MTEYNLFPHQTDLANRSIGVLKKYKLVYIAGEVRSGKTASSMEVCRLYGAKRVLFATKKKAIQSIISDYNNFGYNRHFDIVVINNESLHTLDNYNFDVVIHDESHRFGSFPKPSNGAKFFKSKFANKPLILLSGTIKPESVCQVFHQFWISNNSPFLDKNFYKWHASMGLSKVFFDRGYGLVADYSNTEKQINKFYKSKLWQLKKDDPNYTVLVANIKNDNTLELQKAKKAEDKIMKIIEPYLVTMTQKEAGFEAEIKEHILYCDMLPSTIKLANRLKKDRVIQGKDEVVLADTAVKLMQKLHQIYSGTILFESKNSMVIDDSKVKFIDQKFKGKKIAIFYKFKAEYDLIKNYYGDNVTNDINEFDNSDKNIALQIIAGREGISLRNAEYLIFINIDFSAVSYFQARDRLTHKERMSNDVFWIFSKGGIEKDIYKAVQGKKNYTASVFMKNLKV